VAWWPNKRPNDYAVQLDAGLKSRMVSHLRVCQANRIQAHGPLALLLRANRRATLQAITMQFCLILHLTISLAARLAVKELGLSFRQQTGLIVGY
jgi:hypothetical protein